MLPRACTSSCSTRALAPSTEEMRVGTITMVRAVAGTPSRRSSRGSGIGRVSRCTTRFVSATANSLAGMTASAAAQAHIQCGVPAARATATAAAAPSPVIRASEPR